ncbi:hypothetical protein E4U41_002604 [Claviceps citrina]|nr:hypothetical protein E4U41_002604 [Claviceps citrina]
MAEDGFVPTRPMCVAKLPAQEGYCGKTPQLACPTCLLVSVNQSGSSRPSARPQKGLVCFVGSLGLTVSQYCSNECRNSDWPEHRKDCKTPVLDGVLLERLDGDEKLDADEGEEPCTPWAKYAATDVIRFSRQTEGPAFDGELNVFLGGVFPLRHLIYSVVKLPRTARPRLRFTMNANTPLGIQRTLHGILLLCLSSDGDAEINAEALIHLWYSSRVPHKLLAHVRSRLRDAGLAAELVSSSFVTAHLSDRMRTFVWKQRETKVTACLSVQQAAVFARFPDTASDVEYLLQSSIRQEDRKSDFLSFFRNAARMTRSRALGLRQWRVDGLLIPFDHPREEFDVPNPAFFGKRIPYPEGLVAEPLSEWPMEFLDMSVKDFVAVNDVYGKMFYYLRDMLVQFQKRCRQLRLEIELCCLDELSLPCALVMQPRDKFDRIEHLNDTWASPCATLLIMTRKSIKPVTTDYRRLKPDEILELFKPTSTALDEYTAVLPKDCKEGAVPSFSDKEILRRRIGAHM